MAKTFTAPFIQNYKTGTVTVIQAIAGIGTSAPTGPGKLVTAGPNGSLVTRLTAMPRSTATASSLVLFLTKANGATFELIDSELMAAYTLSVTTAIPQTTFKNISATNPLRLEAGDMLHVGTQVALPAGILFTAEWGDF